MGEWADKWIAIGLSTERADFETFESAVRACYRYAGLPEPRVVVRCSSPLVAVSAGPIAGAILRGAVDEAVRGAVSGAVGGAVRGAVARYMGGQFWVGGWWWGSPAFVSFFQDVVGLTLPGDLDARARAYQATAASACWWWPHRDFVMVSDRPLAIHREQIGPRGWGSHRLHRADGPAVVWPDGWGVYAWHGVRVPSWVIETPPEQITVAQITGEQNAEVRRVLVERLGAERYMALAKATKVGTDDWGTLWDIRDPVPMRVVELVNSTPEPDGSSRRYFMRVPDTAERREADTCVSCGADLARVPQTAHEAVAWQFRQDAKCYQPAVMS